MSIEQAGVIDSIKTKDNETVCVVIIFDHLEWNDSKHLIALQDKINNYLSFIESGEIYKHRPEAKTQAIEISIYCKFVPEEPDDLKFLQFARDSIKNAGFGFSVIINNEDLILPMTNLQ